MKFPPLRSGVPFPELYHLGFNGSELQFFMKAATWIRHFKDNDQAITPWVESLKGTRPGWSLFEKTYDLFQGPLGYDNEQFVVAQVGIVSKLQDVLIGEDLKQYTQTINEFLTALLVVAAEQESGQSGEFPQQLFMVTTSVNEHVRTGYELEVTMSHYALSFIKTMNRDQLRLVTRIMDTYAEKIPGVNEVHALVSGGSLLLKAGNASLGPEGEDRAYLRGHNVDNAGQQLVLLVGLAVIWQIVREGVLSEINKEKK